MHAKSSPDRKMHSSFNAPKETFSVILNLIPDIDPAKEKIRPAVGTDKRRIFSKIKWSLIEKASNLSWESWVRWVHCWSSLSPKREGFQGPLPRLMAWNNCLTLHLAAIHALFWEVPNFWTNDFIAFTDEASSLLSASSICLCLSPQT